MAFGSFCHQFTFGPRDIRKKYHIFVTVSFCSHFGSVSQVLFRFTSLFDIMSGDMSQRWSCGTLKDGVEQMDLALQEQELELQIQA